MTIRDRGFASMDQAKRRAIASKGGKTAHEKGTAHEWTTEEARAAGRKGGMASHRQNSPYPQGVGLTTDDVDRNQMTGRDEPYY